MPQSDRVDPALLPQLENCGGSETPITRATLADVRAQSAERVATSPIYGTTQPRKASIKTENGSVDLYIFEPLATDNPKPCLLWLHGGGYIMGRAKDMWNGPQFSELAGCVVISVEYRLAPEHPFPAALYDAFAALNCIHRNAAKLGIDPACIAIGGMSAGGGLAAGLALYNRDQNGPPVCFQLLLYPMIDNLHDTPSGQHSDHPVWNRADSLAAWEMYLGEMKGDSASPYAAAQQAADLSNLPPAFISVGEVDLFLDENLLYAKRLEQAGTRCEVRSYSGVFHGAEVAGAQTPVGQRMIEDYVTALKAAF